MNFREILEGWRNSIFPPEKLKEFIEEIAEERLSICKGCEYNSTPGKIKMWSTCTLCGCPLTKKVRCLSCSCGIKDYNEKHPEATMPLRWHPVATPEENEEIRKELNGE